ncbi:TIGR00156 family protein, partial [Salmonella enterica subsp. enterica serovar Kentucky]
MKIQVAAYLRFQIMPYAIPDDQGGKKKDLAPPPPHDIEDGYRGKDDAEKKTNEQAKTLHDGATDSLRGNHIDNKGDYS